MTSAVVSMESMVYISISKRVRSHALRAPFSSEMVCQHGCVRSHRGSGLDKSWPIHLYLGPTPIVTLAADQEGHHRNRRRPLASAEQLKGRENRVIHERDRIENGLHAVVFAVDAVPVFAQTDPGVPGTHSREEGYHLP